MSQVATANAYSSRAFALERRKTLSSSGKAAIKSAGGTGTAVSSAGSPLASVARPATSSQRASAGSAREASLARRKAMSSQGKSAVAGQDRVRGESSSQPEKGNAGTAEHPKNDCGCGCDGAAKDKTSSLGAVVPSSRAEATASFQHESRPRARMIRRPQLLSSTAKTAALARRKALSSRGKAALDTGAMSGAQAVRASNPKMSSRELAQVVREQRSRLGGAGQKKSSPCGRPSRQMRKSQETKVGAAQDAPWKVGASETFGGQTVTGTMVGRHGNMTGDEPSTCRTVTGTEYLGADIFNKFCQGDAKATSAKKVSVTTTSHGNNISGNRMGRASNVTGNEPGTCKRVTGAEYVSAEQTQGWCGELANKTPRKVAMAETMKGKTVTGNNVGRTEKVTGDEYGMRRSLTGTQYTIAADIGSAPAKVGVSATLRGGSITGTMVGRRERMTGDEAGSCRNVTGDDYIGQEQYSGFCGSTPKPTDSKVGVSKTLDGMLVTGSLAGRSQRVTGNEPGTCKAVTGTPYAGGNQYQEYCAAPQQVEAIARMQRGARTWGKAMTGLQPGIGGHLTGAGKGACETVSGTPYIGADQAAAVCPATAAEPGSPDFPQALEQAPWGDFSVAPPAHAAHYDMSPSNVTGSQYESGNITGPFGMATGKVTGTEQARFDRTQAEAPIAMTAESVDGRIKSRVTGEGMDAGQRITGDDWERGDRVTGTEGASARRRNPTLRGSSKSPMQLRADMIRPEDIPTPVSKVTGGSGNTEKGALITYSGGARG